MQLEEENNILAPFLNTIYMVPQSFVSLGEPLVIKTAKAKGLSQSGIIFKHAMRNAIMPVVTVLGPITAGILTGGFVVESVFGIPGLGKYFVQSIQGLDYTMICGTTVFYGAFLIVANLVVDIAYGLIDPRVKLEG